MVPHHPLIIFPILSNLTALQNHFLSMTHFLMNLHQCIVPSLSDASPNFHHDDITRPDVFVLHNNRLSAPNSSNPTPTSSLYDTTTPLISIPTVSSSCPLVPARKSTRVHKIPSYLHDYHCKLATSTPQVQSPPSYIGNPHSLSHSLSYSRLSPPNKQYALAISTVTEPQFYH